MAVLEKSIQSEDAGAIVIRRKSVIGLYMIWGVHFIWLALTLTFCWVAIIGPEELEFYGSLRICLEVAGAFILMSIGCSLLAMIEYGHTITVINDEGIKQLNRGLLRYERIDSLSWSEIEEIRMESDQLPRLFILGRGKNLAVFVDCSNFSKLSRMLISKVPKDYFDSSAYTGCSNWSI